MILCLFFTRGVSLQQWVNSGLFYREKLIYEYFLTEKKLIKIYWITYGDRDDILADRLKSDGLLHHSIHILCAPKILSTSKLGFFLYSLLSPFLHRHYIKMSNILKTNQIDGGWSAIIAKKLYVKPLIARSGYMLSKATTGLKKKIVLIIEEFIFKRADLISVTSMEDYNYVINSYNKSDVHLIPNFVDTNTFKNLHIKRIKNKILYVGRLNYEKNLFNLIKCMSELKLDLVLYGDGEQRTELELYAKKLKVNVEFKGSVNNNELPLIYNSYRYYVLPSLREGMPKTLMEAMSCGCLCIGTNVSGIKELISDGETGFLSTDLSSKQLVKAFRRAMCVPHKSIVIKSESFINNSYSLAKVAQLEFKNMYGLLN